MPNPTKIKAKSPTQVLKDRVKKAKTKLAKKGYQGCLEIIARNKPKYNTIEGGLLIKSVWDYRKADIELTEIFEAIANNTIK